MLRTTGAYTVRALCLHPAGADRTARTFLRRSSMNIEQETAVDLE
jgi:hypothetical protein